MKDEVPPAGGIDVTRPSVARVYDFWLGGKDNFAADRDMGSRALPGRGTGRPASADGHARPVLEP